MAPPAPSLEDPFPTIPWNTKALWQEANTSLNRVIAQNRYRLADALHLADRLGNHLRSLFPIMDDLCRQTCPDCQDSCCRHAWVWADFKDLLFLHLAGIPVPGQQLLGRRGEHCRYAGPMGCRLDRLQRPFVCTWYICPAQTRLLQNQPAQQARVAEVLNQIKIDRRLMEGQFIAAHVR